MIGWDVALWLADVSLLKMYAHLCVFCVYVRACVCVCVCASVVCMPKHVIIGVCMGVLCECRGHVCVLRVCLCNAEA